MPRLLAIGHVTWDRLQGQTVLGGSVTYATQTARKLGWEAAALTSAGPDFDPARDLPGVTTFLARGDATTRFVNNYGEGGARTQVLSSRAGDIVLSLVPEEWRNPDVLLLGGVAAEIHGRAAEAFAAEVVGANAQGWVRAFGPGGEVTPCEWQRPDENLAGVHALFLSEHDIPGALRRSRDLMSFVPMIAVTSGWRGLSLVTRDGIEQVPGFPRTEVDPTGAGDVFAATFLMRYQETGNPSEAAVFACCAASCVVEGVAATTLGDRAEILRRVEARDRLVEDGEWEE
ncbi:MAG TPA: PfkB family carbohydrate kinase [Vicinamibacteria bacterium]|nr:PfkB family carbohydrate kinase [Vicinamibacteria bacterium]